jgi:hypothetical protein
MSVSSTCLLTQGKRCPSKEVAWALVDVLPLDEGMAEELLGVAVVRPVYG